MSFESKVEMGRKAVDEYRRLHFGLYETGWHKGIPAEHTPLFQKLLEVLRQLGFNSLQEFFDANDDHNAQQLGFKSFKDLEESATPEQWNEFLTMWC